MASHYGARIRKQEAAVLKVQRAVYECPACGKQRVKRVGFARWRCRACGAEFAGGAYAPTTTVGKVARKVLAGEAAVTPTGEVVEEKPERK
jgi:large subunit ribosomal protein L37Ae